MKKTYVTLAVLVLLVGGFFVFRGRALEAPTENNMGAMKKMVSGEIPSSWNTPVTNSSTPVKEFTVSGQNFSFTPNVLTVKKGDLVKITFKNAGGFHDFRIDEFKVATSVIKTGEKGTVEFVADKTGSFQYYCSVGSHRAQGMWGTLKVE